MSSKSPFINFLLKEWLLIVSGIGLIITSIYTKHLPDYSFQEIEVLFILFVLFIVVNGLHQSGLILKFAKKIEKGKFIPLNLISMTFFTSMLLTNDISIIIMVPITLALNIRHKDILVILEALTANAGSALTPFGNPQNLFIYWYYRIHPITFIKEISLFSLSFLAILIIISIFIKSPKEIKTHDHEQGLNKKAYIYCLLFFIVLLTVFHLFPVSTCFLVIIFSLIFDRKALYIDYPLLITFFFFCGFAANIKTILGNNIGNNITHCGHIFLFSALTSQIISNVPATLLFAKFTTNWKSLLWGVNVGGFGGLLGSLANLIAYRIYTTHKNVKDSALFTGKFLLISYTAFIFSIGLYFGIKH